MQAYSFGVMRASKFLGRVSAFALGATVLAVGSSEAVAQELVLPEIVVTATKRAVSLQDVPQSISAFDEGALEDIGAADFTGLLDSLPGVELRSSQDGLGGVSIRGIAELNVANTFGAPSATVGLYLDELPLTMSGVFPDIQTFDMARVEVLKGPQGTLFGEGSLGGTVRLVTNKPVFDDVETKVELGYYVTDGGSQSYNGSAMLNVPLVEDILAARVVAFREKDGGFVDTLDLTTGQPSTENVNESEHDGGRLLVALTPSDDLTVTAMGYLSKADRGARAIADEDFFNTSSVPTVTEDDLTAYNLTAEYTFDFANLVVSGSYFDRDNAARIDQPGLVATTNTVFGLFGVPVTASGVFIDQTLDAEALTGEIRLVSNDDGLFEWTVGAFYKEQEFDYGFVAGGVPSIPASVWLGVSSALGLPPISEGLIIGSQSKTEQMALFGEASYDVTDSLNVLLGARIFEEDRKSTSSYGGVFPVLTGGPLPGSAATEEEDTIFNPRATISYRFTDDVLSYATYSRGFRGGGQNDLFVFVPGSAAFYDSERLSNYELGMKSSWLEDRLQVNVAGFYMEWTDLQAVTGEGPGGIGEVIGNIGDASSLGIETEVQALIDDNWTLFLSGVVLQAETDEDVLVPDPSGGAPITVASGTRIPRTAEVGFNGALQYRRDIGHGATVFSRISVAHNGDATGTLSRSTTSDSYTTLNLRVGFEGDAWGVTLYSDNVTNEFIPLQVEPTADFGTGNTRYSHGRPRTIGLTVRADF